jgi:hypothetical protein
VAASTKKMPAAISDEMLISVNDVSRIRAGRRW